MAGQGFASMDKKRLKEVSSKGGKAKNPKKGFGSLTPEQLKLSGALGAKIREWYKRKEKNDGKDSKS